MADRSDPVLLVRDLLRNNWDASNTALSSAPKIHTGWYDDSSESPQVTVTNPDEGALGGGDTGYVATQGDGGGPVQERDGVLLVNGWAGSRETTSQNPKKVAFDLREEIGRIIGANYSGVDHLNRLAVGTTRQLVDDDRTPAVYRYEVTVSYGYRRRL